MTKEEIFICMYKTAMGRDKAKEYYAAVLKSIPNKKDAHKVYLNEFGAEVHVNGDVAASLKKCESLKKKIARFDRLAAQVAAIRAAREMGLIKGEDGPDEDVEDFDLLDDVETTDDFGDVIQKPSVAEPAKAGNATGSAGDAADGADGVAGDEPAADGEPGSPAMPSNDDE